VAALDALHEPQHGYPVSLLRNEFFAALMQGDLAGRISR
jgi:hypothetical protein